MSHKPPVKPPPPTKDDRPRSSFRKEATQTVATTARRNQQLPASTQFANTPRFAFGKLKPTTRDQRSVSPPKPAAVQSFRSTAQPLDDVDDETDANEDDYMLGIVTSTEHDAEISLGAKHWMNDLAFSPKRRKLDDENTVLTPSRPTFKYPGAPASESSRPTPFHAPFQRDSTQASTDSDAPPPHKPAFIRPLTEPQEQNEPLPETFSPHKRGQKFVPGGMAATMQQWVIETGQAAAQSRKGQGYLKGEDYVMRAKIESFIGEGPFTAHARLPGGAAVNAILAENRLLNVVRSPELSEGCVVGVRAPTWEVELDGRGWTVGVDWKVL